MAMPRLTSSERAGVYRLFFLLNRSLLLGSFVSVENDGWAQCGKVRIALEKRIRDPDDVFIHAEERRKQLAKHGKKPRRK